MEWNRHEREELESILEGAIAALGPLNGRRVLVLGSSSGEVAVQLGHVMQEADVVGLELAPDLLARATARAERLGVADRVRFFPASIDRIEFPDRWFHALLGESILHPTSERSLIGPGEMARVLRAGGRMVLTDVVAPRPVPPGVRIALREVGLDDVRETGPWTLHESMTEAGLDHVDVTDVSALVRPIWEARRARDCAACRAEGYRLLLDDDQWSLGRGILYLLTTARKPAAVDSTAAERQPDLVLVG
jgi:SAM-dependent methyltransferase